ncbi:hypothetical protein MKW92_016705 [Papaver armeniacum]|nr:hypothetical protein MKW92_016705 [Papaver armeniacum]
MNVRMEQDLRAFRKWDIVHLDFPYIFTCEIKVILKTLVDDDEFQLKELLSSFMGPNHPHSPLQLGYFSKLRKLLKVYHGYDHKL